ncbi:MAG: D-alanine--D-alanine ligase [Deltaproteobacteria bacterium]|nr:D-alanine--D-alanine ligase [Deltaproteobacteria bacterium]
MKIGLTYDLRSEYLKMGYTEEETAEFDRDDTIFALEKALQYLGHDTDRVGNARNLAHRLVAGDRWDLVFNIAEGLNGFGREAQVPAMLDLFGIPYTFSDPVVTGLTLNKGLTKSIVRDHGYATADFKVVENKDDVSTIRFEPPYFVKPVAEGTGKGITRESVIYNRQDLLKACKRLLTQFRQPVLVEKFLCGREFTVGILGTGKDATAVGTMEIILLPGAEDNVYSYINKEHCEELVRYEFVRADEDRTVREAEELSLSIWRTLGCRDGGRIDLRCDEYEHPYFLEVNPLAGIHPDHSDLPMLCGKAGISYDEMIGRILSSAFTRVEGVNKR